MTWTRPGSREAYALRPGPAPTQPPFLPQPAPKNSAPLPPLETPRDPPGLTPTLLPHSPPENPLELVVEAPLPSTQLQSSFTLGRHWKSTVVNRMPVARRLPGRNRFGCNRRAEVRAH